MTASDTTILALDYGDVRVGVAAAHTIAKMPHPLTTLRNDDALLVQLAQLAAEQRAEQVVLGLPRNMDGTLGEQARKTQMFGKHLAARLKLPVTYVDETLSSIEAQSHYGGNTPGKKGALDAQAAATILQRYFDQQAYAPQSAEGQVL